MWLVLSQANDLAALWAARGLVARGLQPLEIVTAEALAYNLRFEHRLTASRPSVSITLADGRVIDGATVRGTLNRLQFFPIEHLRGASSTDRQYAEQELYALYLSWIYGLPGPMLNCPTPQGLSGEWRHPSEWAWLAAQAGLLTLPYQQSDQRDAPTLDSLSRLTTRTLLVVGDTCCDSLAPSPVAAACVRLAQMNATGLLGIDFHLTANGDWVFINATSWPNLRLGGDALLDRLANALQS
jgi:hypothetical protein